MTAKKSDSTAANNYGTRALTVLQPWAWAITDLDKRVENRSKPNSKESPGGLWIHAGKTVDSEAEGTVFHEILTAEERAKYREAGLSLGAVVAYCHMDPCRPIAELTPADRWAAGPFCYPLSSVCVLPKPVPFKGKQGFFTLPDDVVAQCAAQLKEAREETPAPAKPSEIKGDGKMHGAKPHVPLAPAQVEAIEETLDRVSDLSLELGPARKKLEDALDRAKAAKKIVDGITADRRTLLDHLVAIRSGRWQTRIELKG